TLARDAPLLSSSFTIPPVPSSTPFPYTTLFRSMRLRALETRAGGIVGASGCCYAIRADLHRLPIPPDLSRDFSAALTARAHGFRSEEHTSELQSRFDLVCRLLLEKKKKEQTF